MRNPFTLSILFAALALLFALISVLIIPNDAAGEQGAIIVYDGDGKVVKELKFNYIPNKTKYKAPPKRRTVIKRIPAPDRTAPAAPTGARIVNESVEKKSRKKSRRWNYRKVKSIKTETIGDQQVTVIDRRVESRGGKQYREKEIIVDARSQDNSIGGRTRAKSNPPKSGRVILRKREPKNFPRNRNLRR